MIAVNNISTAIADYAATHVGGPYIYGATAEPCTIGYRNARADQYPEYAQKIYDCCPALSGEGSGCVGCKWHNRLAHDCAQLTRFAAAAAGLSLPSGATSQWQDGDWVASGLIASLPRSCVCFVYRKRDGRMVHTGVYMADGTVVEARGHADGVVREDLSDYPWTHWAILRGMDAPEGHEVLQDYPLLKKGAKGSAVKRLQEALIDAGYGVGDAGADGVFGNGTLAAVKNLQFDTGINTDGIVGEMTWSALRDVASGPRYTVVIKGCVKTRADRIVQEHGGEVIADE